MNTDYNAIHIRQRLVTLRPPRIAMGLVLAALAIQWLTPSATLPRAPLWLGGAVAALGFAVMIRAWWLFQQVATPICPTATATTLITGDVFACSRNPMYLGIVAMLAGLTLWTGHPALYGAALAFFAIINCAFCPFEEQRLAEGFGDEYRQYRNRTRRWL